MTLRRGDYVLCNFPFREARGPGPSPHIVLCAATGREGNTRFAIVFYTTSQIDFQGSRRPRQYLFVNKARALELGQKAKRAIRLAIDVKRMPLTTNYFPELGRSAIAATARNPDFVDKVEAG